MNKSDSNLSLSSMVNDDEELVQLESPRSKAEEAVKLTRSHFYFGKTLGEGSFARVVHAKMKSENSPEFAIKIMEKGHIQREKKIVYVMREKQILSSISHPFIIKLFYTFHDNEYLYMCMELAPGGELSTLVKTFRMDNENKKILNQAFTKEMSRFYISELIDGLEYLHGHGIIHMDLKPENLLLTKEGHIKIADFGTALCGLNENDMKDIFVGTAEYVSPEVLNEEAIITSASDIWAVGCILFDFLVGKTPFYDETEFLIFQRINQYLDDATTLLFPSTINEVEQDIISQLLRKDPATRLGAGGNESTEYSFAALKNHPYFDGIPWGNLLDVTPPYSIDSTILPSTEHMMDGSRDEWMLDDDATMLESFCGPDIKSSKSKTSRWEKILDKDENEIHSSLTWKRKGLFSKKRELILTDRPRLLYVDTVTKEIKGIIPWTAEKPVQFINMSGSSFDILSTASGRSYHFNLAKGDETDKLEWMDILDDAHRTYMLKR